ncbi:unnamed protein product [Vitrella brassicaformis CCMP3155]|uniref:Uncharacterized protein n=1 Tax=Vitrella brassicaformis (strain CCMP3155) TaxID=1169540 RepID=A0A0G4ELX7_VITBC|nr:unnamed protein product [Vitrella brassicaformis CCMP3155]|eukprot:CEL97972.1 unnamed protein product [Vitrella brassicaformis CCMP3155]
MMAPPAAQPPAPAAAAVGGVPTEEEEEEEEEGAAAATQTQPESQLSAAQVGVATLQEQTNRLNAQPAKVLNDRSALQSALKASQDKLQHIESGAENAVNLQLQFPGQAAGKAAAPAAQQQPPAPVSVPFGGPVVIVRSAAAHHATPPTQAEMSFRGATHNKQHKRTA